MQPIKRRALTFELAHRPGRPDRGDPPFAVWNAIGADQRFYEVTLGSFPYPRVAAELLTDGGATRVPIFGMDPVNHQGLRRLVKGICRLSELRQQLVGELERLLETNLGLAFRAADEYASGAPVPPRPEFNLEVPDQNTGLTSVGPAGTYDRHGYWVAEQRRGWIVLAEDVFFEDLRRSVLLDQSGSLVKLDAAVSESELATARFRMLDDNLDSLDIARIQASGLRIQTPCDPDGWLEHYYRAREPAVPAR